MIMLSPSRKAGRDTQHAKHDQGRRRVNLPDADRKAPKAEAYK
jgi:hypothetical protein